MALRPTQNKEDAEFIALARQQGEKDGPVAWNQLFGQRLQRSVKALVLPTSGNRIEEPAPDQGDVHAAMSKRFQGKLQ
jgi:hypothetical protein